jgi:hypothetical protein
VQLDAVEARLARAPGCGREQLGQHARQLAHVGQVQVGHALALAVAQRLELAGVEHPRLLVRRQGQEGLAHGLVALGVRHRGAVLVAKHEELPEEPLGRGPPADPQEVDDLHEQLGVTSAGLLHHPTQLAQPGHEAIVADP